MKTFQSLDFDPVRCQVELDEFKGLLDQNPELQEKRDIKPFFEKRAHLSAYIGSYSPRMTSYSKYAFEWPIYGDFIVDLVAAGGDRYCFVEFEDATAESIFKRNGRKVTREWSPRFEHGFSQIVDWFWKLDDMRQTEDFRARLGAASMDYMGILVIGRDAHLDPSERVRLDWRMKHATIASRPVLFLTLDELHRDLSERLQNLRRVAPSLANL